MGQTDLSSLSSVIIWSAVLLGLIIVAFWGYAQFKRWMTEPDAPAAAGFTLSDLRELHRQGKMTTEEFETARAKMVASARELTGKMPEVLGKGRTSRVPPQEPGSG